MPRPSGPTAVRPTDLPGRTLAQVAARLGLGLAAGALPATRVSGITHDSRAVVPGDLYAALPGSRAHGAQFSAAAAASGAVAVLTDSAGEGLAGGADLPVLVVADPRDELGPLAAWIYGEPAQAFTTVGITGTNGKTTTAYLVESGLRAAGLATGLVGTIETRIGDEALASARTTPESTDLQALFAVMRQRGVRAVAMEVSSHALAMGRVRGTTYDVAVFTNLSADHLDYHADLEDYFAAKARLFTPDLARLGVVNVDDPYGERLASRARVPIVRVSPAGSQRADWRVVRRSVSPAGSTFRLEGPGGTVLDGGTSLPGAFNLDNAALAVVALVAAGVEPRIAADGVAACRGVPGRMERVEEGQAYLALVDYAHSPDALEHLLATVRPLVRPGGRLVLVIGCGGDRDPHKRPVMGEIAARDSDVAILTDDNPRSEDPNAILAAMHAGASRVEGGGSVEVVPDRRAAIEKAVGVAADGDVLVVAGKGHEQGQEVAGVLHPFDDRAVLRAAIRAGVR